MAARALTGLRDSILAGLSGKGLNRFLTSRVRIEVVRYCDLTADLQAFVGRAGSVILDVGANVGQSAETYSRIFPAATIYSIEPFPDSYDQLVAKRIPRVKPIQAAMASVDGQRALHVNADSRANSLLPSSQQGRGIFPEKLVQVGEIQVNLMTLDRLQQQEGFNTVDFLKIDTQGSELEVLNGGPKLLPSVRVVQVESNFIPQYEGSSTFSEVDLCLREAGFRLYNIYNIYQDPRTRQRVYALGLFLNGRYFRP